MDLLKERLRKNGMRLTPQRMAVLEYIYESKTHPTAQDIYQQIKDKFDTLSLSTVYNNLNALIKLGYAMELTYGDAATRYDYKEDDEVHYHAICLQCGNVIDFEYSALEDMCQKLEKTYGFDPVSPRLEVFGYCKECKGVMNNEI
ncbi:transcriptional repressor [Granulicatella sp. zg-ZJ]|uniref:Fur family transcriptional regulator n=1 Tax=unclassified Granulicatella TaxID=2630493 RepID=UPI0013BFDB8E|nr:MULTISPECIES: Fur family transcriptional regulator [unclassified Granulicatella]MBS4750133.1 transcriptional repressor [Carnobacteriaceae bacterium zg-ZUI78]NEW62336.1 transcriptional repressor [Granulicatella sp. zg-ZJ]NEW65525.1 transcriptional repressor [Granulicatella sp. zg-84]QMI85591.1 transcriptional repressor [Carnobacteriaceae bacterium zg-84]